MKPLQRSRYYTMNSWNLSTAPAYNLKVPHVIEPKLQQKVFELMDTENFYDAINDLIHAFDVEHNYNWQAGFNGRSGGYLVLYRGGKHSDGRPYSYPGKSIEDDEIPVDVLKSFRKLAVDIVKYTEYMAKTAKIENETYTVEKTRKLALV